MLPGNTEVKKLEKEIVKHVGTGVLHSIRAGRGALKIGKMQQFVASFFCITYKKKCSEQ